MLAYAYEACAFSLTHILSLSLFHHLSPHPSPASLSIVHSADFCDSGTSEHALLTSELLTIIHSEGARHERVLEDVETYMNESCAYDFADFMEAEDYQMGSSQLHEWPPNENFLHEDYNHVDYEAVNYIDILPRLPICPSWCAMFHRNKPQPQAARMHADCALNLWCVQRAYAHHMYIR